MGKTIKIQIIHDLAMNSAMNETYQKGVIDKAVDQKMITAAFHEQAGNEEYHKTMLGRSMFSQIEILKTLFSDYLTGNGNIAEDATIDSTESNGMTEILLSVSDRFNNGYTKSLARLSQKFVEDRMIHLWWLPVSKEYAAIYSQAAEEDRSGIMNCFHKTAPTAPSYKYPVSIEIRYPSLTEKDGISGYLSSSNPNKALDPIQLFQNPWIMACSDECEISYTLTGENGVMPVDDIVIRCDNTCVSPFIYHNGIWGIRALRKGITIVTLFSRHNDQVYNKFAIQVTD